MKKIANIVTHNSKKNGFNELFNVVQDIGDCIPGIPTMVIGWKRMKEMYPDADILTKEFEGIRWTFTKTERRCDYEDDIMAFYSDSLLGAMKTVKYVYVDPIKFKLESIRKMLRFLKGPDSKTMFITRGSQFMFVYSKRYETVFGISLSLCEYLGIPKKKVIRLVRNGTLITDTGFLNSDIRRIIGANTHYILPLYDYFR